MLNFRVSVQSNCQKSSWHPKNCVWHLFSYPQMALFKKRRIQVLRICLKCLTVTARVTVEIAEVAKFLIETKQVSSDRYRWGCWPPKIFRPPHPPRGVLGGLKFGQKKCMGKFKRAQLPGKGLYKNFQNMAFVDTKNVYLMPKKFLKNFWKFSKNGPKTAFSGVTLTQLCQSCTQNFSWLPLRNERFYIKF